MNLAADPQFPTKWPFPPVPPADRAWGLSLPRFGRGRSVDGPSSEAPASAQSQPQSPSAPPVADSPAAQPSVSPAEQASASASVSTLPSAAHLDVSPILGGVTVRHIVVDILLVAIWGAMIPTFMWLGAVAGF
jgi:hypothetical protein